MTTLLNLTSFESPPSSPDPLTVSNPFTQYPGSGRSRSKTPLVYRSPNLRRRKLTFDASSAIASSPSKSMVLDTGGGPGASPWRIKVTVEAEPQDDMKEEPPSPSRRAARGMARTMTIPIKDAGSSPAKKRPRRSGTPAVRKRAPTPGKKLLQLSQGDMEDTLSSQPESSPAKRRGRPRKNPVPPPPSSPPVEQSIEDVDAAPEQPTSSIINPRFDFSSLTPLHAKQPPATHRSQREARRALPPRLPNHRIVSGGENVLNFSPLPNRDTPHKDAVAYSSQRRGTARHVDNMPETSSVGRKRRRPLSAQEPDAATTSLLGRSSTKRPGNAHSDVDLWQNMISRHSSVTSTGASDDSDFGDVELTGRSIGDNTLMQSEEFTMVSIDSLESVREIHSSFVAAANATSAAEPSTTTSTDALRHSTTTAAPREPSKLSHSWFPGTPADKAQAPSRASSKPQSGERRSSPHLLRRSQPTSASSQPRADSKALGSPLNLVTGFTRAATASSVLQDALTDPIGAVRSSSVARGQDGPQAGSMDLFRASVSQRIVSSDPRYPTPNSAEKDVQSTPPAPRMLAPYPQLQAPRESESSRTSQDEVVDDAASVGSVGHSKRRESFRATAHPMSSPRQIIQEKIIQEKEAQWQAAREEVSRQIRAARKSDVMVIESDDDYEEEDEEESQDDAQEDEDGSHEEQELEEEVDELEEEQQEYEESVHDVGLEDENRRLEYDDQVDQEAFRQSIQERTRRLSFDSNHGDSLDAHQDMDQDESQSEHEDMDQDESGDEGEDHHEHEQDVSHRERSPAPEMQEAPKQSNPSPFPPLQAAPSWLKRLPPRDQPDASSTANSTIMPPPKPLPEHSTQPTRSPPKAPPDLSLGGSNIFALNAARNRTPEPSANPSPKLTSNPTSNPAPDNVIYPSIFGPASAVAAAATEDIWEEEASRETNRPRRAPRAPTAPSPPRPPSPNTSTLSSNMPPRPRLRASPTASSRSTTSRPARAARPRPTIPEPDSAADISALFRGVAGKGYTPHKPTAAPVPEADADAEESFSTEGDDAPDPSVLSIPPLAPNATSTPRYPPPSPQRLFTRPLGGQGLAKKPVRVSPVWNEIARPVRKSGVDAITRPMQKTGADAVASPVRKTGVDAVANPVQKTGTDTVATPVRKTGVDSGARPAQKAGTDAVPSPARKTTMDIASPAKQVKFVPDSTAGRKRNRDTYEENESAATDRNLPPPARESKRARHQPPKGWLGSLIDNVTGLFGRQRRPAPPRPAYPMTSTAPRTYAPPYPLPPLAPLPPLPARPHPDHPLLRTLPLLPETEPWSRIHYAALDSLWHWAAQAPARFAATRPENAKLMRPWKCFVGMRLRMAGLEAKLGERDVLVCALFWELLYLRDAKDFKERYGEELDLGKLGCLVPRGTVMTRADVARRLFSLMWGAETRAVGRDVPDAEMGDLRWRFEGWREGKWVWMADVVEFGVDGGEGGEKWARRGGVGMG
ncbi:hypothetical protein EJ06DRAFT_549216 [Trichodelitschia bisporula]|uniref:Uncharacterized protein n=1 Tax=Trichodelitschia bisporula TaxID=703511 RepID=A0A6G1HXJ3_9PEZI|nr:hypothetical protein EJ06DRAFT_549216 [Trichodelitschia bisporula]